MVTAEITDHFANKDSHGCASTIGIRLQSVTTGSGTPLPLLRGGPKTSFY
jgi:hypothetical protein